MKTPSRPVLRWHGGKWKLAPWLVGLFPPHRVYVEPFGGAASVLLRKQRSYAEVYNDLDDEVVNLFKVLRDPAQSELLRHAIQLTPFARHEFVEAYEDSADPIERARRLVIRSFMGFGSNAHNSVGRSGFRANSNRSGTTPAHDWVNWPEQIPAFVERLRGVVIENRHAHDLIAQHDTPDTLFYVDPPYPHGTRCLNGKNPSHFYAHEMGDAAHVTLAEVLHRVEGMVILSGYPCDLYDQELYKDWYRLERKAFADGARERTEVVWINAAAWEALHPAQMSIFQQTKTGASVSACGGMA